MAGNKKFGNCHICGEYRELTKEHVPPKAAFNNHKYHIKLLNDENPFAEPIRKLYLQGGIGFYTLCAKCNNDTGSWYGNEYVSWSLLGVEILRRSQGKPSLYYLNKIFPLRIIKQIIVMMFSVNGDAFRTENQYLVKFVLDKFQKGLPDNYSIYVYFNFEGNPRYKPYSIISQLESSQRISVMSEVTFPPYGFVLTMQNSVPPDERLTDVTYFSSFGYDTQWDFDLNLKVLPTWLPVPGDYRTKNEIAAAIESSKSSKDSRER